MVGEKICALVQCSISYKTIYEEDGLILYPVQVSEHKVKGKSITVKKADVKPGKVTAQ